MAKKDFLEKHAGQSHDSRQFFSKIYEHVIDDLVKTVRDEMSWWSDTQQKLFGEAVVRAVALAREYAGAGRAGRDRAEREFREAIKTIVTHSV
jgi:hypothetical protein